MSRIKTIQRTDEMSDWARYVATYENGRVLEFKHVPFAHIWCGSGSWWAHDNSKTFINNKVKYKAKNWESSLRKIIDRPTRKELHAEIAKLNNTINHMCPAWVGVDLSGIRRV
jgi:hypothetical protein